MSRIRFRAIDDLSRSTGHVKTRQSVLLLLQGWIETYVRAPAAPTGKLVLDSAKILTRHRRGRLGRVEVQGIKVASVKSLLRISVYSRSSTKLELNLNVFVASPTLLTKDS